MYGTILRICRMQWTDFKSFDEYLKWFAGQTPVSAKVGVFSPTEISYFTATANFFKTFVPEVKKGSADSPIGKVLVNKILLDASLIYAPTQTFPRQGDFIRHSSSFPQIPAPPDFWMVTGHTCILEKTTFVPIMPVYRSTTFTRHLDILHEGTRPDFDRKAFCGLVEANRNPRFISWPDIEPSTVEGHSIVLIADLDQICPFGHQAFKTESPMASLTFEGLSYFQCRIAIRQSRDLQLNKWDDLRKLGHQP